MDGTDLTNVFNFANPQHKKPFYIYYIKDKTKS